MSLHRGIDGSEPVRPNPVTRLLEHEEERAAALRVATGTLACPRCDAPVAPARPLTPGEPLACPFCAHAGAVRDFLSLEPPTRPARVEVRIARRARL